MCAAHKARLGAGLLVILLSALNVPVLEGAARKAGDDNAPTVDFERHIMGLFGRQGCNAGSCHGSFQGRGGFRLSLFGYDPAKDYTALTRDFLGRRIDPVDPDRSLVLLKATGQVDHGGGRRFSSDSWQYQLFRDWIAAGSPWRKGSGELTGLTLTPSECHFKKIGEVATIAVQARFADGSQEDITRFCDFRINDDAVAEVVSTGQVKSLRPGDTALVVSYRGNILPVRVLVPVPAPPGFQYPEVPEVNYIDREVLAKLRRLNVVPSDLAGDGEFLRRVTIDTIGCLPPPDEVRAFLSDTDANKRAKKIEQLLSHPMHAALWATKFCDITGNNTDALEVPREKRSKMWHDWFRKRVAENMPYDEIVRGVLCATSRDGLSPEEWIKQAKAIDDAAQTGFDTVYATRPSLDLFWRRQNNIALEQWGEKTAAAFMGVRLECAQCHKHPFDRWTQSDYRGHANVFGQVAYATSPECKQVIEAENAERKKVANGKGRQQLPPIRELYVSAKLGNLTHPDTNARLPAKALGGPEIQVRTGQDARSVLFDWLRAPDNPYFARSFVNRVWGHYFGSGIVDPVDDFSLANPPSNAKLLDALAQDFAQHKFDLRHIERTILNARVYQFASLPNETNRFDRNNFSHSYVRRLMAEVVVDVLDSALGVSEDFGGKGGTDVPAGSRAIEVAPSRVQSPNLAYIFRIFGRPPRTSACDCERAADPALPQTLFLMTDQGLLGKLEAPNGRLQKLLKSDRNDEQIFEELVLATLTRMPTDAEKKLFTEYRDSKVKQLEAAVKPAVPEAVRTEKAQPPRKGKGDAPKKEEAAAAKPDKRGAAGKEALRQRVFVDLLWVLINTREFILNH